MYRSQIQTNDGDTTNHHPVTFFIRDGSWKSFPRKGDPVTKEKSLALSLIRA
jgi:hypothetical protein